MSFSLVATELTLDDYDIVQDFDCGSRDYQREVSDWLKKPLGSGGALDAVSLPGGDVRVLLYWLAHDLGFEHLVGFGSLGKSEWRWTGKKDPFIPVTVITWFAVQNRFKRQPPGDPEEFLFRSNFGSSD